MARKPRAVADGIPHHVTQRGSNKLTIFYGLPDREVYLDQLFKHAQRYGVRVLGYCLMTNHVHLLVVPERPDSLARVFGRTHSDYARYANLLRQGCGHLWQARFYSCPVEEGDAWAVLGYVERNPVRAGMVSEASLYRWSSAAAHCAGWDPTGRLDIATWRARYTPERWSEVLASSAGEEALCQRIRDATGVGLPLGSKSFVQALEARLARRLERLPPGRPRRVRQPTTAAGSKTV
jgi:putative transposase